MYWYERNVFQLKKKIPFAYIYIGLIDAF